MLQPRTHDKNTKPMEDTKHTNTQQNACNYKNGRHINNKTNSTIATAKYTYTSHMHTHAYRTVTATGHIAQGRQDNRCTKQIHNMHAPTP